MNIGDYLDTIRAKYDSGQATELSYRAALEELFQSIDPAIEVINEPKKSEGGMPDFLFQRNGVAFGWAEAKGIDKDVIKLKGYSVEQRKRYENAYPNLIYTNGVDFEFIRDKEVIHHTSIADFMGELGGLQPLPGKFDELERQLTNFAQQKPISIRSADKLAEMMAAKAAIIKDEIGIALLEDPKFDTDLGGQYVSFRETLLPNLTLGEFADIYAETITYGMFAARFHDDTLDTFSRQEALEKLPASNPFLKGLFKTIAGDLPKRLVYVVDDLVAVMRASDPHSLFEKFGEFTARNDPFIHFYENFLAAYNPKKRKSRGVWYTPEPVVDFIVRAVDDVLKTEFGIAEGLASTERIEKGKHAGQHKVQILDPATGTGTFLAKVVQTIADRVKARAPGKWSNYVEEDLLPRLHGFELLMASYAMCHMKLDMMLDRLDYKRSANPPEGGERLSVWLTNALEPAEEDIGPLFFQALRREAQGASRVKNKTPIMCVIGNPPYSAISQNMDNATINALIEDYKYVDGEHFGERKHWLHDDYVKFIRMSEDLISQNPSGGVLGFISNHGYLDNPTFRGMRWHLLKTFDKIWVLDLHGNANKQEVSPDGTSDKNVFDIRQGVSIILAVRKGNGSDKLAEVKQGDLWGSRSAKNKALGEGNLATLMPLKLKYDLDQYPFVERDFTAGKIYNSGFSVSKLLSDNVTGIVTMGDGFIITNSKRQLRTHLEFLLEGKYTETELKSRFSLGKNYPKWVISNVPGLELDPKKFVPIAYRPFDSRWTYFDNKVLWRWREDVMRHLVDRSNLNLMLTRQTKDKVGALVVDSIAAHKAFSAYDITYNYPLYLYPADDELDQSRRLNLNPKLYAAICKAAGIDPADQAGPDDDFRSTTGDARPSEVKVFDYIYGVLHSPDYRATFAEFLKIDFPRIPYPASPEVFAHVSEKGEALRRLHLMEAPAIGDTPYRYHGDGDDVVASGYPKFESSPSPDGEGDHAKHGGGVTAANEREQNPSTSKAGPPPPATRGEETGRVHINPEQYFADVPAIAWSFHIGGYQPAQKWLKDRKGRSLSYDDIGHYQKIVKILIETDRIMKEIELPLDLDA